MEARRDVRLSARQLQPQVAILGDAVVELLDDRWQRIALGLDIRW